jgi:hypothetical protein
VVSRESVTAILAAGLSRPRGGGARLELLFSFLLCAARRRSGVERRDNLGTLQHKTGPECSTEARGSSSSRLQGRSKPPQTGQVDCPKVGRRGRESFALSARCPGAAHESRSPAIRSVPWIPAGRRALALVWTLWSAFGTRRLSNQTGWAHIFGIIWARNDQCSAARGTHGGQHQLPECGGGGAGRGADRRRDSPDPAPHLDTNDRPGPGRTAISQPYGIAPQPCAENPLATARNRCLSGRRLHQCVPRHVWRERTTTEGNTPSPPPSTVVHRSSSDGDSQAETCRA